MSAPIDQVRVRLSAEGIQEVVGALNRVKTESEKTGSAVSRAFSGLKSLLPAIGFTGVVAGLTSIAKAAFNAADQIADTSKQIGVSAESLSRLAYAAKQSDVEFSDLVTGIKKWQVNLSQASTGSKPAIQALDLLGLKAKDLKGLKLEDQLGVIADRFRELQNPADQTRVAVELFGKSGATLIPLLKDGAKGIKNFTDEADRLHITLNDKTIDGVNRLDEAVKRLKATLQGRVQSFLGEFSLAVLGTGDQKLDEFSKRITQLSQQRQQLLGGGQLQEGSPEAERLKQVEIELGNVVKARQIYIDTLNAQKKAEEDAAKAAARTLPPDASEKTKKFANATVRSPFEANFLIAEGDRLLKEVEDANKAVFEITQKTLEAQGRGKEAELAALDDQIAKYTEILALSGKNADTVERITGEYRKIATAQIEVQDSAKKATEQFDAIDRARAQLEQDVQLGRVSEQDAKRKLLEIEKERLAIAKQFVDATLAVALASGNPELIAQAEELKNRYGELLVVYKQNADAFQQVKVAARDALESGVSHFLDEVLTGTENVGEAFKGMARSILDSIAHVLEDEIAKQFVQWLLAAAGGSGWFGTAASAVGSFFGSSTGAAAGGLVSGPGTGTSDSIPARLSDGEFVMRAAVVDRPGVLEYLSALNAGIVSRPKYVQHHYAAGGLVVPANHSADGTARGERPVRIVNVLDPNLVTDAIASSAGERAILNIIQRNGTGISRMLRG